MAKSRRRDAAGSTEFRNLVDLDTEKRAARQAKKSAEHSDRGEPKGKDWREELVEKGGTEKERRTRIAALYSDLRELYNKGSLTKDEVQKYLEDFPSEVEYEAYKKISEAIKSGEISEEVEGVKDKAADESLRDKKHRDVKQRIREVVGGKRIDREARVPVLKARPGVVGKSTAEEKSEWSVEDWYRFLLREYATGQFGRDDIKIFFEDFSPESKEAHKKLLNEIGAERKPENKLSREDIEEMLMRGLGVREELIKDIPTEGGKTLFEEMLDDQIEIFKGVILDTVSRADYEKKMEAAGGDRARVEKELIAEEAKKFLAMRELFTHGVTGYDKENGRIVLQRYSDLDGKCAIALLGKAGLDIKNVGYLTPGEMEQGQITVDSGNRDGLVIDSAETVDPKTGERKMEVSAVMDHHGPYSDRGTSATKNVYKVLTELGLLKFEDEKDQKNYEKVVEWVTKTDNFSFPDVEKYFKDSDQRMIGFLKSRFVTLNGLLNFADSGKEVTALLDEKDLRRFGLIYKRKKGGVVDHVADRKKEIEKTMGAVRDLAAKGWTIVAENGKKFIIDTQNKIGGEGQWAAASLGYEGVIRYTPESHNFFVALNKGTFDKETFSGLPQGKLVRGSVFIKLAGGEKLTVTLSDLLQKIAPNFKIGPKTELRGFLDTEPRRIRAIIGLVEEKRMEKKRGKPLREVVENHYWWTNAPDGKKVIVKSVPGNFKSGGELYVRLREPTKEDEERYGMKDFYVGYFEPDEIILPKKPAEKKEIEEKEEEGEEAVEKEPAKSEAKPAVPATEKPKTPEASPEKELSPPERERREKEKKLTEAVAAEEQKLFHEFLQKLEGSEFYGKWDIKRRENFARAKIKPRVEDAKKELRKKYGL